jgi:hypothetical protein
MVVQSCWVFLGTYCACSLWLSSTADLNACDPCDLPLFGKFYDLRTDHMSVARPVVMVVEVVCQFLVDVK